MTPRWPSTSLSSPTPVAGAPRASRGDNTFHYDLGAEDEDGEQDSTVSVFVLDPDGRPRHVYSCHPRMADDIQQRGIDLLSPVWHVLDLTPQGRGEWFAGLDYCAAPLAASGVVGGGNDTRQCGVQGLELGDLHAELLDHGGR
ncbi:MAG TPA: DUF899 family protein, partial [Acidimicrobiales bacterium]